LRREEVDLMIVRQLRIVGALAVLAVGAVHLQQYIGAGYSAIPTVGTLFLLNAIGSGIVGTGLLLPLERALAARPARAMVGMLALAAVAIAAGSLLALLISESGSLFGFSESGYRTPIVVSIVAEAATIVLLAPVVVVSLSRTFSDCNDTNDQRGRDRAARPYYGATS
jgi:hypothetical protein